MHFRQLILAASLIVAPVSLSFIGTTPANADQSLSAKISWFGTLRGKVGYAANDWLFYGTGGLAYGQTEAASD